MDFWGRIRRCNEAARAEILASEESRHAVYQGLITDLASGYFQLRELDLELEISRRTLQSRQESLRLVSLREQRGVASLMDVRQSETLVTTAAATIPVVEQQIEQTENFINYLLAQNPGPVPRGKTLVEQVLAPAVPAGLPSTLLDRRPDVRQAEQVLVAENARIGVAKAALFPQISLTGSVGTQSNALSNLFTDPSGFWSVGATLTQPLFNAGRLRANVRAQEARQRQALLGYRDTIQRAFREVADTLIGYQKTREFRQQQEILTKVLTDAARLSRLRYDGGVTSYLEVLDSERQLFDAELDLAQAQRDELISVVQLYRALGGGWQL